MDSFGNLPVGRFPKSAVPFPLRKDMSCNLPAVSRDMNEFMQKSEMTFMKKHIGLIALLSLLLVSSCSEGGVEPDLTAPSVKQIDITEAVFYHVSTLEYFDYVVTYQDNKGQEYADVISGDPSATVGCYVKTYSYNELPVTCTAIVELVPKVPETEVVSFKYINPKPSMSANVYYSSNAANDGIDTVLPEGYEQIWIQSMEIGEFLKTYGSWFSSYCRVLEGAGGLQVSSY